MLQRLEIPQKSGMVCLHDTEVLTQVTQLSVDSARVKFLLPDGCTETVICILKIDYL